MVLYSRQLWQGKVRSWALVGYDAADISQGQRPAFERLEPHAAVERRWLARGRPGYRRSPWRLLGPRMQQLVLKWFDGLDFARSILYCGYDLRRILGA